MGEIPGEAVIWIGLSVVGAGLLSWLWTSVSFLADPGYGGFDMSSASAFDVQWTRGAALVGIGIGVTTSSWPIGVATFLVAFFSTMLAKPALQSIVRRRQARQHLESSRRHSCSVGER